MCCRIAGSVNASFDWVQTANEHQRRGGIDAGMIMRDTKENVVFGHRRLAIIDLTERGNQPVDTSRYTLTYNGEIYNYKELWPEEPNDTLGLLHSIHAIGLEKTLPLLNGMFAFGLYDEQEQKVHLVVDRFAQKNLYYYHLGNQFYFASNPAALYNLESSWTIDKDALQSYWLLGSCMGENSIFCGIKKLCAAEHLTYDIRENKITIERWYEPKFQDNTSGIEDLVFDAIDKTKVSDVPIHIFLSGGIDSTLVVSRFQNGNAIHLDSPELEYAQQAANRFNIDLKVIKPETIETEQYLTDYSLFSGEPTMAGIIPYTVAKETAKYGKVAISANGADELFFGYNRTTQHVNRVQSEHIFRMSAFYDKGVANITNEQFPRCARLLELYTYVQYDLNKTLDFASMCHGLEVRSPFLDHRLVEMALSIHEREHRKPDNKTILKRMLGKIGFDSNFLNRPKLGFSLFRQPERLDQLIKQAWNWVHENGFLNVNHLNLSGRDRKYLEMSALGFYYWFKAWQHKIK
jgi:asparagine synthase (glutamine-hydrolysing)